jgi:hypothetical protein
MSNPVVGNIVIPVAAQQLSLQYKPKNLIQEMMFPIVPLNSLQAKVAKYSKSNMFRLPKNGFRREEGSETARYNYNIGTIPVAPWEMSAEFVVTDEMIDIGMEGSLSTGQLPIDPTIDAVQHLVALIDLDKEKIVSDMVFSNGNAWADGTSGPGSYGAVPSGGNGAWALDTTANTFITDVFNAKETIRQNTGYIPNKLEIDYATFVAQQFNPQVSEKIKYTQRSVVTEELLAVLLQLDEVLVGRAVYTSSQENKKAEATTGYNSVWNPSGHGNAFLFYQEAPGLRALGAGYQFRAPYKGSLRFMEGYRDFRIKSMVYSLTERIEIVPTALDVGYAWSRTIS